MEVYLALQKQQEKTCKSATTIVQHYQVLRERGTEYFLLAWGRRYDWQILKLKFGCDAQTQRNAVIETLLDNEFWQEQIIFWIVKISFCHCESKITTAIWPPDLEPNIILTDN